MAFCKKYKQTIKKVTATIDEVLNDAIGIAHSITSAVGKVMADPEAQFLISFIPDGSDKTKILGIIEEVILKTEAASKCTDLVGTAKITCMLKALNLLPETERNNALLNINTAITAELDGNRYKTVLYNTIVQGNHLNEVMAAGKPITA